MSTPRARAPAVVAVTLLLLTGCLAAPPTPPQAEERLEDPRRVWGGSDLEGVSCDTKIALLTVPAERVQAHLPDNLTTRGSVTTEVLLRVSHCRALVLDAGAPLEDAWFYMAHAPLRSTDHTPADARYLLEAGSDSPSLLPDLAARHVPVLNTTFHADATGITLTAPGVTYRLLHGTPDLLRPSHAVKRIPMLAGHPAATHLLLEAATQSMDLAPTTGLLDVHGGVLGTLIDAPAPVVAADEQGPFLLRHPNPEEQP